MKPSSSNRNRQTPFYLSLADLHRSLDDSPLVRHISVPLESCGVNDDARAVRGRMEERNYDVLGVKENGVIQGYVRRQDLKTGRCRDYLKQLRPVEIIASTTPLIELLPLLRFKSHLFVLERTSMTSLVTRADLQKSPVRMLLFGLVSLLEMYLLEFVRLCYPGDSFQEKLAPGRLEKAEKLLSALTGADEEIDLASCLKMADKRDLLIQVPGFVEFFALGHGKEASNRFKQMERLRDKLAHGQDLIAGSGWDAVLAAAAELKAFLRTCDEKREEFVKRFGQRRE
jgi:hypothetical protein